MGNAFSTDVLILFKEIITFVDINLYLMERELDNVENSQTVSSKGQLGTQVPTKEPVTKGPTRLFSHLHAKPERGQQFFFFFFL